MAMSVAIAPPAVNPTGLTRTPLWEHQTDALNFMQHKPGVLLAHEMGCLPGDTIVTINRGGNAKRMHLADVVDKFDGVWTRRPDVTTHVRGMRADGSLGRVALTAVHRNGEKPLITICTSGGRRLRCTADHEIVTPHGKVPAGDLALGDELLVDGHHGDRSHFPGAQAQTDRVAYVLRSTRPEPVYDLTVDDPAHAYVADGIVVGNSGKSLTTIARLEQLQAMRVLVLCPRSVTAVWGDQVRQHATRTWHTWAGEVRGARGPRKNPPVSARAAALVNANTDAIKLDRPFIAAVNYEASIANPMPDLLVGTDWDAVILDESHRIKSPGGKQSRLAARICQRVRDRGGHIIALTGTPMSHSPLDLYAQLRALDGGKTLGTNYQGFCRRYGAPKTIFAAGGVQRLIYEGLRDGARDEFAARVAPVVHQAAPDLGLHDVRDVYRTFELTGKAQRVYDSLERHGIAQLEDGVVTAANAMVVVTRLAQCTGGYATDHDTGHSHPVDGTPGKAKLLADVLADIPDEDGPVVVFCRFRSDLDAVHAVADQMGRTYAELSGRRRDALNGPRLVAGVQVAGVQIKSGGTGIDLTAARHGIYYSLGFELAEYEQSRKRLHRPGQTRRVVLTHLLAEGTIDRAIYGALRKRGQVIDAVLHHLQSINP